MAENQGKSEGEAGVARQGSIVNNLENVPTIFIDGIKGMITINGVVKINAFQVVQDFEPDGSTAEEKRVIVARLTMAPPTLISIMEWLGQNVKYEKVEPSDTASGDGRDD